MRWAITMTRGGWCRGRRPWEVVVVLEGIGGRSSIRRIVLVGMGRGITSRGEGKEKAEGDTRILRRISFFGYKDVIES